MKSKNLKTVNVLESMTKYKTFSRYNKILEKNFKNNSLKSLVHNLKHPKVFIRPKFLEEFNKKYPIENQELSKIDLEMRTRNFTELLATKKRKIKKTIDPWTKSIHEVEVPDSGPDPLRYTPNYKSVFKTIPSHKFSPLRIKNDNINQTKELNHLTQTTQNTLYNNKFNDTISISTKNNDEIPSKTLPSISTISLINSRNNHAYKFGNYIPRKERKKSYNTKISYIEPVNHIAEQQKRTTIDFRRMIDRANKSILINRASLHIPTSYYYDPNYNSIDKKTKTILFNHKKIIDENIKSNKFLIHKLWTSYNVTKGYKLIDNDKLKKDVSLDID